MADYIEKEQIKNSVKRYFKHLFDKGKYEIDVLDANADINKIISELPAIERLPAADVVSKETHEAVVKALQAMAETDVVPVVRCKDCKHYVARYCTRDINRRTNMFLMNEDNFCSCGERKTDNG